jgi:hypothetical protein
MTITETNDFDRFSKNEISGGPAQAFQNLKFEREDWTLFRTVEGLQQKAGVPAKLLRRLILKELGDNALDTGAEIRCGEFDENIFYIEDDKPMARLPSLKSRIVPPPVGRSSIRRSRVSD